jgi:UDP-GlcNAc:undecaprenyl-phosphate GlcNAc-1-phosphate transferase
VPELLLLLVVTAAFAAAMGPPLLRSLADAGATVTNYRGEALPCPLGLLLPAAVLVAFVPLALLEMAGVDGVLRADGLGFVLGAALLGLADDAYSGSSRGWRGHFAAVRDGRFSTGALKAVGIAGLALYVTAAPDDVDRWILGALVLVLATNLFNLLDLRPGRAVKGYVLVAAACAIAAWDESVATGLAAYTGAIVAAGLFDLREQGMMGDTGSNAIGAVAGLWLIATIDSTGGLAVCVAVLAALTAYGEFRSISAFIERTPLFRHLDSLGRVNRA